MYKKNYLIYKNKKIKKISNFLWSILFILSLISLIIMWLNAYLPKDNGFFEIKITRSNELMEKIILPFYFTHIANLMALVLSVFVLFKIIKNKKIIRIFLILTVVNLQITFLLFWFSFFILRDRSTLTWFQIINNLFIHLIMPFFMTFIFLWTSYYNNKNIKIKFIWKKSFLYLVFVLFWIFIISTPIYYILGFVYGDWKNAAIYPILNFSLDEPYNILFIFLIVNIIYYFLTLFFLWISNPILKKNI